MNIDQEIETLIRARYPILYILSSEEMRVQQLVLDIAQRRQKKVFEWSCSTGIVPAGASIQSQKHRNLATRDPLAALDQVIEQVGLLELAMGEVDGHVHVALGVEPPRRFEWTPLYFKEISIVGSNGFGIEELDGRRQHAMEWYFELIRTRGFDATPIISHRFPLDAYRDAFMTCYAQGRHDAVKVLFDRFESVG